MVFSVTGIGPPFSPIYATLAGARSRIFGRDSDVGFAAAVYMRANHIARSHRAHARRRAGHDDVSGVERIHRRAELDQPLDVVDEVLRVRILLRLAVHL